MNAAHHVIRHRLVLELIGPETPTALDAELRYDPTDPYAVSMAFLKDGAEIVWVFARDLLLRGVSEPVGDGDVQVFPSVDLEGHAVVALVLLGPTGSALLEGRARDFFGFLAQTTRAVWPGTERNHQLDTDDAIAAILVGD
jgi:sporulation and cell division protein SsgA